MAIYVLVFKGEKQGPHTTTGKYIFTSVKYSNAFASKEVKIWAL
jgi:hypothetical protein